MSADSIAIVTTVRAKPEQVTCFLDYHIALGVSRFYLFFDDPDDSAVKQVKSRYTQVEAIRCDARYWTGTKDGCRPPSIEARQRANTIIAMEDAARRGLDWLAHLDIDEFLFVSRGRLVDALAGHQSNSLFIRLEVLEAIPDDGKPVAGFLAIRNYKYKPFEVLLTDPRYRTESRFRRVLHRLYYRPVLALCRWLMPDLFGRGYYNGHSAGKSITRISQAQSFVRDLGIHFPVVSQVPRHSVSIGQGLYLLHFDSCSYEEWFTKWARRVSGTGLALGLSGKQLWVMEQFSKWYQPPNEARLQALYDVLYRISPGRIRLLRLLGLVKRIELP